MTATSIRDRIVVRAVIVREAVPRNPIEVAAPPAETFYMLFENGDRMLFETSDLMRYE